jgi:hypothetical protein
MATMGQPAYWGMFSVPVESSASAAAPSRALASVSRTASAVNAAACELRGDDDPRERNGVVDGRLSCGLRDQMSSPARRLARAFRDESLLRRLRKTLSAAALTSDSRTKKIRQNRPFRKGSDETLALAGYCRARNRAGWPCGSPQLSQREQPTLGNILVQWVAILAGRPPAHGGTLPRSSPRR